MKPLTAKEKWEVYIRVAYFSERKYADTFAQVYFNQYTSKTWPGV